MTVLIDTNILISACLFPGSKPSKALEKALIPPYKPVICQYSLEEIENVVARKFQDKAQNVSAFLFKLLLDTEILKTATEENDEEEKIRDVKDRPILRVALGAGVDMILTGDKDFLEADIVKPKMITAADFLKL